MRRLQTTDTSPFVGFGIIEVQTVKDVKTYIAAFMPKVKFTEPSETFATKGESITYQTPSISGKATGEDADNTWKITKQCDTETDAITWLTEKLGGA